jgi:beta-lactamase regulating signal transducer with metallopeptidase domain/thiol-disulfide isomerase/thioredoxin
MNLNLQSYEAQFIAKLTIVLAGAWVAQIALSGRNPRWRVWLWRVAAIVVAVLLTGAILPPLYRLPLLQAAAEQFEEQAFSPVNVELLARPEDVSEVVQVPTDSGSESPKVVPESVANRGGSAHTQAASPPTSRHAIASDHAHSDLRISMQRIGSSGRSLRINWWSCGFFLYGAILTVLLLRLALGWFLSRRWTAAGSLPPGWVQAIASQVACDFRCLAVSVRMTDRVQSPVLIGVQRPTILLPTMLESPSPEQDIRGAIAHEMAHASSNDLAWDCFIAVITAFVWPHPLAWRIRTAHRAACERVSDRLAADYLGDLAAYQGLLARAALRVSGARVGAGLAMARRADVRDRLAALATCPAVTRLGRRAAGISVGVTMAALVLAVGSLVSKPNKAQAAAADVPAAKSEGDAKPAAKTDAKPAAKTDAKPTANTDSIGQSRPAPRPPQDRYGQPHPFTIRGKALNHEGNPVAGAEICILSTNRMRPGGVDPVVAKTVTDVTGAYLLRDVALPILAPDGGPIRKFSEGVYQVFGTAGGYGFTWHSEQLVRPEKRPAESSGGSNLFYEGEEGVADLVFDLPATIQGQLRNDRGQPLAGVRVEIGYVRDVRRPDGPGSSRCAYLGPPDAPGDPPDDSFRGMDRLPEDMRLAVTDTDGRYKITGLRRETIYAALIEYGQLCDPLSISLATTNGSKGRVDRRLGYDARLDHVFVEPPAVTIQVVGTDGKALPNVTVRAARVRILRGGNVARTDAAGRAILHLPPDSYKLIVEPSIGTPLLPKEAELVVPGDPVGQTTNVMLEPGAVITLSAVEAETNKPIAGVSFFQESDSGQDRRELQSHLVIADYPVTDENGELRAIVSPGSLRFVVEKSAQGFEPVRAASDLLTLTAEQPQVARFEFRKTPAATTETATSQDELSGLRELLAKQRSLPKSGTYFIKQATAVPGTVTPSELRKLIESWNPTTSPDFFDYLSKGLPSGSLRLPQYQNTVTAHGEKQRIESTYEFETRLVTRITVSNGHENVVLDSGNAQASLTPAMIGNTRQSFGPSPFVFYTLPTIAYARASGTKPVTTRRDGKLIIEWGSPASSREVVGEQTGFLHHAWSQAGNGFGREAWYFSPRRMGSGLNLAHLTVQCQWNGERLTMLHITQLEDVKLGAPPPETFVVSAPAGTNIVDFRDRGQDRTRSPKSEVVSYPVADVVMVANRISDSHRSILPVLKKGQAAPPIEPLLWLNATGQTVPPEQKGKVVLVDFWGIWCGPCIAELPDVQGLATEFAKKNFLLVGLHESSVDLAEVAQFAQKRGLTYQLAIDRPAADSLGFGATFKAYGIQGIPNCAVIDQQGHIAYVGGLQQAAVEAANLLVKDNE